MGARRNKTMPLIVSASAAFVTTVIICVFAAFSAAQTLAFGAVYYFVCYSTEENSVSASSLSDAVSSYGGAGYVLCYDGKYYVTIACYYETNDAETVCASLKRRGLNCTALTVKTEEYKIRSFGAKNKKLFLGNLNTLDSLTRIAYECANNLDTGDYSQTTAKSVLNDIYGTLCGLKGLNAENCFTSELDRLLLLCEDIGGGYIYSKDVRKLQIAVADTIINIELY